jgi:pimeloyl-ACP methyl ester carboxylesterase
VTLLRRTAILLLLPMLLPVLAGCSARTQESLGLLASLGGWNDTGPPITRQGVTLPLGGEDRPGDLYRRADRPSRAGLVLVPGVTPQGREDPRLVEFAELLAEARFLVLVPELPNLRRLQVRPEDADDVAEAVAWLADRPNLPGRVGLAGISYAAGPAFLAALRPETRERLGFLLSIGGYYDITAVVTYFTTGYYRDPEAGVWRRGSPDPRARWVFLRANAGRLDDPDDAAALSRFAASRLAGRQVPPPQDLSPEGEAVLTLLLNDDPERVPELINALPEGLRSDLEALDLADRNLAVLDLPVLLLHGRDDPVIPASESIRLDAVLPRSELYLADALGHVDGAGALADAPVILRLIRRTLELRDAMAGRLP